MLKKSHEMAYAPLIFFLILLLPLLLTHAYKHETCPELINYSCNDFNGTSVMSPFTNNTKPDCGLCVLDCNNHTSSTIQCGGQQLSYQTKQIQPHNNTFVLVYPGLRQILSNVCNVHRNDTITIPNLPKTSFKILNLMVFYRCDADTHAVEGPSTACGSEVVYGPYAADIFPKGTPPDCVSIQLPHSTDNTFSIKYHLPNCFDQSIGVLGCHQKGKKNVKLILTSVLPGCMLIILALVILYCRKRKIKPGSSAIISFDKTRSYHELEEGSVNGVTPFSYQELEEVTNHFDPTKLLGEGGFGIVYHGKLRDGREVAVKRLYEKSPRRIQQFENEIKILTHLRHNNLVTLYGYTSHHSSELLLVYEYIPNGTVTDHLRGEHPNSQFLTWSTRMNIAIETAQVLSYLHYNDIIHRDVKTNNILLDNSFSVKVADFGLSRLFPVDVTHVSTAPQGTPGYVDPEYHQCYHLTDKSDVYSFGVVLIELLSSLPAVDVGRHRHEINLSNYAFNKIKCCAFGELVDPKLGFETDSEVRRMTTLVAELAFRCLQHDREVRPSMDEVLHALKMIVSLETDIKPQPSSANIDVQRPQSSPEPVKEKWLSESMKRRPSLKEDDGLTILRISKEQSNPYSHIENDDVGLLRNAHLMPTSPDSVMDIRFSKSCTPNTSN